MGSLDREAAQRVHQVFMDEGLDERIVVLEKTARSAPEAARALDVKLGAIVKSLVFRVGEHHVLALVAGDQQCREDQLPRIFNIKGNVNVVRPSADEVRAVTGFSVGGVAPIGLITKLPLSIDVSLKRFDKIYTAAGHPHCVFETTVNELKRLTGGLVSYALAAPVNVS